MPLPSISVVMAVATTFLQMLVDSGKLEGWQAATAKGLVALITRFQVGTEPSTAKSAPHVVPEGLLDGFPFQAITPDTVQEWGEVQAGKEGL